MMMREFSLDKYTQDDESLTRWWTGEGSKCICSGHSTIGICLCRNVIYENCYASN
jgi:hypothetical protein